MLVDALALALGITAAVHLLVALVPVPLRTGTTLVLLAVLAAGAASVYGRTVPQWLLLFSATWGLALVIQTVLALVEARGDQARIEVLLSSSGVRRRR